MTEAGVAGCNWQRPLKRPAQLDARPSSQSVVVLPPPKPTLFEARKADTITVKPKHTIWESVRHPIRTYKEKHGKKTN